MARHQITLSADSDGLRLDQCLMRQIPLLSRRTAKIALDIGCVFLNGKRAKVASKQVRSGDKLDVHLGGAFDRALQGNTGKQVKAELTVLFEDEHMVVVVKPAGLLTAPTPEGDRNNLLHSLQQRAPKGPRIYVVHRLDLQTSGVLVFAKSAAANSALSEMFREHRLVREYDAFVLGAFTHAALRVDSPVKGKHAVTELSLQAAHAGWSWLRARLHTGRTHQIRVHTLSLGFPVLSDPEYGERQAWGPPRLALHARRLAFEHPITGQPLNFELDLPDDLQRWANEHHAQLSTPAAP
jgi:23S rRNA pseudouridine1911/1915/1917 synthase